MSKNNFNKKKIDPKIIIEFNKRFEAGEQNIRLDCSGNITEDSPSYFWQSKLVFNVIHPIVMSFKSHYKLSTKDLYGDGGIVDSLVPLQIYYNFIKNKKIELINRLSDNILTIEDGSVDADTIEENGLQPGKLLIYRHGSNKPTFLYNDNDSKLLELLNNEEKTCYDSIRYLERLFESRYYQKAIDDFFDDSYSDDTSEDEHEVWDYSDKGTDNE